MRKTMKIDTVVTSHKFIRVSKMFKYIYRFFTPKYADRAAVIKFRLSVAYAFLGWNFFMVMMYKMVNQHLPSDPIERKAEIIKRLQGTQKVHVIKFDGFNLVEEHIIQPPCNETEEELEVSNNETKPEELLKI